tara:strand:+ start:7978 stop:8712 length:735 start_codon:yes stop_codon:yes gene_type:complete
MENVSSDEVLNHDNDDLTDYSSLFSDNRYYYELFLRFLCSRRKLKEICHLIFYEENDYYEMLHKHSRRERTPEVINQFVENEMKKYDNKRCLLDTFHYPVNDNLDMIKKNLLTYSNKNNLKVPKRLLDLIVVSSLIDIYFEIGSVISYEIYMKEGEWSHKLRNFLTNGEERDINLEDRNKLYTILIHNMNTESFPNESVRKILFYLFENKDIQEYLPGPIKVDLSEALKILADNGINVDGINFV